MPIRDILTDEPVNAIREGVPFDEYLSMPWLSGSPVVAGIKREAGGGYSYSTKHLRAEYEAEKGCTDPMRIGRCTDGLLFDCLVPARHTYSDRTEIQAAAVAEFHRRFGVWDGSTRRGAAWSEFKAEWGDDYVRSLAEFGTISAQVEAVTSDPSAAPYWKEGVSQVTLLANEGGIQCKGRPDFISTARPAIVDLKTTADLSRFWSVSYAKGYDVKFALYRRWWRQRTGHHLPCVCIAVEQSQPYDVAVVTFPEEVVDAAERRVDAMLLKLRASLESDTWPGIAGGAEWPLFVPAWAMDEDETPTEYDA